jgi:hypothetical protein
MNSRNPTATSPITPSTRATISSGRWRLIAATAKVQPPSISTHSSIEPSCEPHDAASLYCTGSCEFELVATLTTEKSLVTNEYARQPKAMATNRNSPAASGRASAIHAGTRRAAPASGSVPSTVASSSARISANCPSSGIMVVSGSFALAVAYCRSDFAALSIAARVCAWSTAAAASGGM